MSEFGKKDQVSLTLVEIVLEAIPKEGVPSGHLYAALMTALTPGHYNVMMTALTEMNAIKVGRDYYVQRDVMWTVMLESVRRKLAG